MRSKENAKEGAPVGNGRHLLLIKGEKTRHKAAIFQRESGEGWARPHTNAVRRRGHKKGEKRVSSPGVEGDFPGEDTSIDIGGEYIKKKLKETLGVRIGKKKQEEGGMGATSSHVKRSHWTRTLPEV